MKKNLVFVSAAALVCAVWAAEEPPRGNLQIAIREPRDGALFAKGESLTAVEGMTSVHGGVKYLDLFLVMDSSGSLQRTDEKNYRSQGAAALVRNLSAKSNIHLGVVDFDDASRTLAPLSPGRDAAVKAVESLDQNGGTNLAAGIESALDGFASGARPDSTRVLLLFTDGKSSEEAALSAADRALAAGVMIHTLQLGESDKGEDLLKEIAFRTGGVHVRVDDPSKLPEAFLNLRTTGVEKVDLFVNGNPTAISTVLVGGEFSGTVPLRFGKNQIAAVATSLDGRTARNEISVTVLGDLKISIESPARGTVFTGDEMDVDVRGAATMFENLAEPPPAYPDMGVQAVHMSVNGEGTYDAYAQAGRYMGRVPLKIGENRIVVTAEGIEGRKAQAETTVTLRPKGCGNFRVQAMRNGNPALSISDRAVEIVFDASNSMWAQVDKKAKIEIAKQALTQTLGALSDDLAVALRVYGHRTPFKNKNCQDSELLSPPARNNRDAVRQAVAAFTPKGQTPLAYSLSQVQNDLFSFDGEKAVILLTDGVESCDGDPVAEAKKLQSGGQRVPVHVIAFALGKADAKGVAALQGIAEVSGGSFIAAENAEALRQALAVSAGTGWRILRDGAVVSLGAFGHEESLPLPEGDYVLEVDSLPPFESSFRMNAEENLLFTLDQTPEGVKSSEVREPAAYQPCPKP